MKFLKLANLIFFGSLLLVGLSACENLKPKKVDQRQMPDGSKAKARKNIDEGRGAGLNSILGGRGGTNYEFSTSNPLWRASLETLDFLPLTTVDYSGGTIITDWYANENDLNSSIKITVRFLSNEITATSLKVIVHQKKCTSNNNCNVQLLSNSAIKDELNTVILKKASLLEKEKTKKK
mgnify:CR=1 FL=1